MPRPLRLALPPAPRGRLARGALALALALLAGCDALLAPVAGPQLRSGLYTYDTWTDRGGHAWWGYVELDVGYDGTLRGSYRLPDQCTDGFGYADDCTGYVGGRVYPDGSLRFGFDEGWLRHDGWVGGYSGVEGRWDTRVLGYYDSGEFELVPY